MQAIDKFIVEIDKTFLDSHVSGDLKIYTPTEGNEATRWPRHGKVLSSIDDNVKVGDTLFFVHFSLFNTERVDGKVVVTVPTDDILGHSTDFPEVKDKALIEKATIKAYGKFTPAKITENGYRELLNKKGLVAPKNMNFELPHVFTLLDDIEEGNKEDRVWVYTNSDIRVKYLEGIAFIEKSYITYNETQQESRNDYLIVEIKTVEEGEKIILDQKVKAARGIGVIVKPNTKFKELERNDIIKFQMSGGMTSPMNPELFTVPYRTILGKYERNN